MGPMDSLRARVDSWIRDQTARIRLPPPPPGWRWPPWKGRDDRRERERLAQEEYQRHRKQLQDLCRAVKAESVSDLQDVLCSMILSECVYKRPATEMIRVINKFKFDFGGQVVSLERVQPSLDHVPHKQSMRGPHLAIFWVKSPYWYNEAKRDGFGSRSWDYRYLLAEAGDTLFASFIGTKQYKDVIADVNIFQGAVFHDDNTEDFDVVAAAENDQADCQNKIEDNHGQPLQAKLKQLKKNSKPAAHRGFLARAKGIPALELYNLAKKKNRKLVLCGHSLGGAVAALATLAILRVLASSTISQDHEKVQVKCITFSQPPVGNAALRDYVHQRGWEHYFKSYCIPEDLVPRILSPAYFHHYNSQTQQEPTDAKSIGTSSAKREQLYKKSGATKSKDFQSEQLVLGLGPVQTSLWRLSKLVPLDSVRKHLNIFKRIGSGLGEASVIADRCLQSTFDESEAELQSLVIQEGSGGISLSPLPETDRDSDEANNSIIDGKNSLDTGDSRGWRRVPYLPSYIPFGQLYLLGSASVESLSDAEYSKLTSVSSVITELRERFQSHSMKSYRSRFQKIYDLCMCVNASPFLGLEQLSQFPHLQQWLGLEASGVVELGHIVESPVIRTATSLVPLGWNGTPGEKNVDPLKVDVVGHGLHLCTFVQAQVNGKWCSTVVESLPPIPTYSANNHSQPDLQKMRILVGAPLKRPPKHSAMEEALLQMFPSPVTECNPISNCGPAYGEKRVYAEGFNGFVIYCTSDFVTVSKNVYVRTRRVRLVGLKGAGKTSLFKAILDHDEQRKNIGIGSIHMEVDGQEGVKGGLCYIDSPGVNLQAEIGIQRSAWSDNDRRILEIISIPTIRNPVWAPKVGKKQELLQEASRFKDELQMGIRELSRKIDLVVLVQNLSQKIPQYNQPYTSQPQPALSLLLNEATSLGIPWVLAITNKYSVSSRQQKSLVNSAIEAFQATPSMTKVINSCPFIMSTSVVSANESRSYANDLSRNGADHKTVPSPINRVRMLFQKKAVVLPAEDVASLQQLVHCVLRSHEEMSFQELSDEILSLELAREQETSKDMRMYPDDKGSSVTAAAIGASLGAGLGVVIALVMGAASALRKP